MELIAFIIAALFIFLHLFLFAGLIINSRNSDKSDFQPLVSLVICAKDEELHIEECIKSVINLNYPADKIQVLLVNDRSQDRTKEIMLKYVNQYSQLNYLEITEQKGILKGKANALEQALKHTIGEIIFTTDADIKVNPNWIRRMLDYYDEVTGVVAGFSVIEPNGLFYTLQSIDWLYLLSVASGGDGIGIPISCVGNNMSYRKKAYEQIGGYANIKYSITEDFMLLQKIHRNSSYKKTKFPIDSNTVNITLPCQSIKQLFRQKKRWALGGMDAFNLGIVIGILSWLYGAVILFGWLFLPLNIYLMLFASKLLSDFIFILPAVIKFKMFKVLFLIPLFEIYYSAYVIITSVLILIRRDVIWKG